MQRFLHWLVATLVFLMLTSGLVMINMRDSNPIKWFLAEQHESVGVLLFLVLLIKLLIQYKKKLLSSYGSLTQLQRVTANITHVLLYFSMFIMVISGYLQAAPFGVYSFSIPIPVVRDEFYIAGIGLYTHIIVKKIIIGLILFHIAGYLYHRFYGDKPIRQNELDHSAIDKY